MNILNQIQLYIMKNKIIIIVLILVSSYVKANTSCDCNHPDYKTYTDIYCSTEQITASDLFNSQTLEGSPVITNVCCFLNDGNTRPLDGGVNDIIDFSQFSSNPIEVEFKGLWQDPLNNHFECRVWRVYVYITSDYSSFNLPSQICQNEEVNLLDYASASPSSNNVSFSATENSYLSGNYNEVLKMDENATLGTFSVTASYELPHWNGSGVCSFSKTEFMQVKPKANITFPLIQTGQILDSDNTPIPLSATTDIPAVLLFNGPGVTNSNYTPSDGGNGLITLSVSATTNDGCLSQETQDVTVTYDPGIPTPPKFTNYSSGFGRIFNDGLVTGRSFAVNYESSHSFHLCDGQPVELIVDPSSIDTGYDSIIIQYINDNNTIEIGTFDPNNSIFFTIPTTNGVRLDKLKSKFKSSIGTLGSVRTNNVYVSIPNERKTLDTICDDNTVFDTKGYSTNDFTHFFYSSPLNTQGASGFSILWNEYDSVSIETDVYDMNSNLLFSVGNSEWTSSITNNSKSKTLIRKETSILPNHSAITRLTYPCAVMTPNGCTQLSSVGQLVFNNIQTCESEDTLIIVKLPEPNYNYSGDTLILGGTSVQVESTSLFSDWVSFDFYNGKGEQIGDTIIDTLYTDNGLLTVTAYDNFGCSKDTTSLSIVQITNDPGIGLLDEQTNGLIYPVKNGLTSYSGMTDSIDNEMHLCDGQEISIILDLNSLKFNNGIDSVKYSYLENGNLTNIGKFHILDNPNYTIPLTNLKRVDTLFTQLFTVIDSVGQIVKTPIYVSYPLQREPTTQILNCNETLNYTNFIGQNQNDFEGLYNLSYQGSNADFSTFNTEFRDVNGNIQFNSGVSFNYPLTNGVKVDTIFKKEIAKLPFRSTSNNNYYNNILNPQVCIYNDTIVIVRPPVASYVYQGLSIIDVGTSVRHISTSVNEDWTEWDFNDGSQIYSGDTMWHAIYDIGLNDITVMAYDIYGCADTLNDVGYIQVKDWTGINEEQNILSEVLSYPNPMQGELNLKIKSSKEINVTIYLLDMNGKIILDKNINLLSSENLINLNVSSLSSGIYNCQIIGEKINISQKIIKR